MGVVEILRLIDHRIEYTEKTVEEYRRSGIETFAFDMILDELKWLRSIIRSEERHDTD